MCLNDSEIFFPVFDQAESRVVPVPASSGFFIQPRHLDEQQHQQLLATGQEEEQLSSCRPNGPALQLSSSR